MRVRERPRAPRAPLSPLAPVAVATWFTVALALALVLSSCTGGDDPEPAPTSTSPSDSSSTADAQRLQKSNAELVARIVQIDAGFKKKQRTHISRQIAKPIRSWMDAAYLAGDFPRGHYTHKDFPGWTRQAAALATRDKRVTTNAAVSHKVVRVVAHRRTARLFVFAVRGRTGGASAKVAMTMTAELKSGHRTRYAVAGQLYLTRKANHWRIFGYDLHRTVIRR